VSTDRSCGDLVVRNCHVVSNSDVVLNRPLLRPYPSASFWGPGVVSQSPDGRHRCLICHSVSILAIIVQFELIAVSFVDLTVVYQLLHAADTTSVLSCNVRDSDT